MWRRYLLAVTLVVAPLGGCIGLGDEPGDAGDEPITRTRAVVDEGYGAVEGVVTDNAVQTVPGATVELVELDRTALVDEVGAYAFSNVDPGTYTVSVRAAGFVPAVDEVVVEADDIAVVDFILVHLASDQPYMQTVENAGFMEYGWGVGHNATGDAFWVRDTNCDYDEIAGATCRGEFELDPPLQTLIFEMSWEAAGPLAEKLQPMLRVSDNAAVITGEYEFFSIEGASPLTYRMDAADLDAVLERFAQRCDEGEDQFCGMSFRDEGWPLQTRVWPSWQCPTDTVGFCALIEQDYVQYVSAFYNAPAPAGFLVLDGDTAAPTRERAPTGPPPVPGAMPFEVPRVV